MRLPGIQAVIFDLGRVIVPFDFERGYRQLSSRSLLSTEEIRDRIRATGLVQQFETGLIEPAPFVAGIGEALGIAMSVEDFSVIWNSIFLQETLIPEEMLTGLKRQYRLLLLSNTNALHFAGLEANYPLLQHFHHHVLSYRVQVMKPDPEIYRKAAELAGCKAGECLFIDDLEENVAGAQRAGMQAVLFRSREELEGDFTRLGVVWK